MSQAQQKNPQTGFWERVPEPKAASVWAVVTYAGVAFGGLMGLIVSPVADSGATVSLISIYWAGLLFVGGLAGAIAVLPGLYWLERIGIVATGFGLLIFLAALQIALWSGVVGNPGSVWPVFGMVAGLLANIAGTRWSRVKYGVRDPERFSTYPTPQG